MYAHYMESQILVKYKYSTIKYAVNFHNRVVHIHLRFLIQLFAEVERVLQTH